MLAIGTGGWGSEEVSECDWEVMGERGQNQRHIHIHIHTKTTQLDLNSHSSCVKLGKLLGLSELLFHFMGG